MYRIAVFVSGRGSNLKAIIESQKERLNNFEIIAVVGNKSDCGALDIARQNGIETFVVAETEKDGIVSFIKLAELLEVKNVNLIVLAGFIKKIPDSFIDTFENRIINIHPALLPSFGGKGMYGMNVHRAVFESSAKVSGATVHFVDKIYDNGKIIAQRVVNIDKVNTPEEIAALVLQEEHKLLPFVISKLSENKVNLINNRVIIKD